MVDTDRVVITPHAVERFLLRYPSEVLPIRPEREIRGLLRRAKRLPPRQARRYGLSLQRPSAVLAVDGWIFPIVRGPAGPVLPTVLRRHTAENDAAAVREERLRNWEAFRSGRADRLLVGLAVELGTTDPSALARAWRERGYPRVQHGGYPTFEAYCRSRTHVLREAAVPTLPDAPKRPFFGGLPGGGYGESPGRQNAALR